MQDAESPKPKDLEEELRSIRKAFEVLLLAIEAEGVGPAMEIAGRIMVRLDEAIRQIRSDYANKVLAQRFQPVVDDHQRLVDYKNKSTKPSSEEFIELVSRIERHIATVDHEMRVLIPQEPRLLTWGRRHGRQALAGVLGVGLVAGSWVAVEKFLNRNKGLIGEYHSGTNFRKLVAKRRDDQINISLKDEAPIRGLTAEQYSVRWTGLLKVPTSGTYEFVTRSDDGVRLWIDEKPLIDNWTVHRQFTDKVVIELTEGAHKIKLEWFQRRGPALIQLYWRRPGDAQPRLIESDYLQPEK